LFSSGLLLIEDTSQEKCLPQWHGLAARKDHSQDGRATEWQCWTSGYVLGGEFSIKMHEPGQVADVRRSRFLVWNGVAPDGSLSVGTVASVRRVGASPNRFGEIMAEQRRILLMIETSRAYGRSILRGIAKYSRARGPWIFHRPAPFYWGRSRREGSVAQLLKLGANGAILREQTRRDQIEEIVATGIPVIVAPYTEPFSGVPNIVSDDRAIGRMAAHYFLHRGFRQFAYCGFGDLYFWSRERGRSFCQTVRAAGYEAHHYEYEQRVSAARGSWAREQTVLVDWLKSLPKPVGLMACNDDRSQYVLEACKIAGLHVPEQVAIVGMGNDDLVCDLAAPRLSSIAVSSEKAGYEAAAMLDRLMAGEEVTDRMVVGLPSHVVTRQSTDVFAVADRHVREALRFIHAHASRESVQVDDVVKAIGLSRRSLYECFASTLGRSVHEEIKRVRTDRLARLLVSTDLSISQIASKLGCTDMKNLARYFKQEMGMTPLQYRKRHLLD
jgi:LacI family transcriptional regulator